MSLKIIITGATGMVGEGVAHECINHSGVESVLLLNRKPSGITHPKVKEIIVPDFFNLAQIENQLSGYNACFFCLGVSSVGMKEDDYRKITYGLTMHFARTALKQNPDMVFCYVSGVGTDSTEQKRVMWARVKGKTENDLMKLGFKGACMFRPGYIQPTKGLRRTYKIYKMLAPAYPLISALFPKYSCTLRELGLAMIAAAQAANGSRILECLDIRADAKG